MLKKKTYGHTHMHTHVFACWGGYLLGNIFVENSKRVGIFLCVKFESALLGGIRGTNVYYICEQVRGHRSDKIKSKEGQRIGIRSCSVLPWTEVFPETKNFPC